MPPPAEIHIRINGRPHRVTEGTTAAAAILNAGPTMRTSVTGEPRAAICGMGICFECRATINGTPHQRTCQLACAEGMEIETT